MEQDKQASDKNIPTWRNVLGLIIALVGPYFFEDAVNFAYLVEVLVILAIVLLVIEVLWWKSGGFGHVGTLAYCAYWMYLIRRPIDISVVPEFYLIPLGLEMLLFSWLNRDKWSPKTRARVNYLGLFLFFGSQFLGLMLRGAESQLQDYVVLGITSISAIVLGVLLNLRSPFLIGGVSLFLFMFALIGWTGANFGWKWLWLPIALGPGSFAIVLIMLAFEKTGDAMLKRAEILMKLPD